MARRKRGAGEGTIYQRKDKSWLAQLSLPERRRSYYGKTRAEAQRKLDSAKADLAKGLPLPDGRQTVKQYLEDWIDGVQTEIRPSSYLAYRTIVLKHLIPTLGALPLLQLDAQAVKRFQRAKTKTGLSPTTVRQIQGVLHRALRDALDLGLVQRNAADRVKAPRRAHKEMQTLSEEQANHLLEVAQDDRLYALYVLALTTGMREGELCALHWKDVDLERKKHLIVRYTAAKTAASYVVLETKTDAGRRTIALNRPALAALAAHKTRQKAERVKARDWREQDLVFPNQQGGLLLPPNVWYYFQDLRQRADVPTMRFHDLRHTAATIAIARGVQIKTVSEMLGHADIAITLRIYAHVTPAMQQQAVDVMDTVFGG